MNKQTNSAMGMLINAYRGILKNSRFESMRGSLIAHNKCLHAGFIALLCTVALATASSPVHAEKIDETINDDYFDDNQNWWTENSTHTVNGSEGLIVEVDSGSAFDIENLLQDEDDNYNITTTQENISIISQDNEGYGIRIRDGSGSLTFDSAKNIDIEGGHHAVSISDNATLELVAEGIVTITSQSTGKVDSGIDGDAINISENATLNISGNGIKIITSTDENNHNGDGIHTQGNSSVELKANNGSISISTGNNGIDHRSSGNIILNATTSNFITAGYNTVSGQREVISYNQDGIRIQGSGDVSLTGERNYIWATDAGLYIHKESDSRSTIKLTANGSSGNNTISSQRYGISATTGKIELNAQGLNKVTVSTSEASDIRNGLASVMLTGGADMAVMSGNYSGSIALYDSNNVSGYGISLEGTKEDESELTFESGSSVWQEALASGGTGDVEAVKVINNALISGSGLTIIDFIAQNENTSGNTFGLDVKNGGSVVLSGESFTVKATSSASGDVFGISASSGGDIDVDSEGAIQILAHNSIENEIKYGTGIAIKSDSSKINLTSNSGSLNIYGAVHAVGTINNESSSNNIEASGKAITIQSHAVIERAGDLEDGKSVFSAVYAEDGAKISLSGSSISLKTKANHNHENELERVVWAYNGESGSGTSITMDGHIDITTDQYVYSPENLDVAVAAGTAVGLTTDKVNASLHMSDEARAQVNINYARGENYSNKINGDILAAYAGVVNIKPQDSTTRTDDPYGINIQGDLLAGNGGVMNIDIGSGTLEGRIDDYGEAGYSATEDSTSTLDNAENGWTPDAGSGQTFRNPAFSSEIYKGGAVNLTMRDNSVWKVTKQSWVTSITTADYFGDNGPDATSYGWTENTDDNGIRLNTIPLIDLNSIEISSENKGAALTVYKFNGDAQFRMHLDGEREDSDMLYIKEANGDYVILLDNPVTNTDIENSDFDNLRFATVGAGSNVTFRVFSLDAGLYNLEYKVGQDARTPDEYEEGEDISVGQDSHENNSQNVAYDGDAPSEGKPGAENVNNFFDGNGTVPSTDETNPSTTADTEGGLTEDTNFALELTGQGPAISESLSDAGKTVLSMSRANYFNAVYMDTLNKRQGQAHFADPNQDDGM
ncbi:MAG: hypothetical protein IAA31_03025, partial [Candidatus Anaerobiospirillum merdipullorum]|nr:hypothetical protein [Candidatus Anaerobiospirillum merdipullorum]